MWRIGADDVIVRIILTDAEYEVAAIFGADDTIVRIILTDAEYQLSIINYQLK